MDLQIKKPKQAVVLCGGLGTRLGAVTNHLPKPMIPCNGKPFLWYLLQQLHGQGVNQFLLLTGYLGNLIEGYFGDGSSWGWVIEYSHGPVEWDTGKRIWEAKKNLDNRFLLLYADNFALFPLGKMLELHEQNQRPLTLMVSMKSPGNLSLDDSGVVQRYNNNRSDQSLDYVEIGYMIVEKDKMFGFYETPECSFSSILRKMGDQKQISAWIQGDSYHSISDPERWKKTEEYLKLKNIILIDRDGVINKKAPRGEYISRWEDFEWIEQTRVGMKLLSKQGFKFIVISNQAGVARGMVDPTELDRIHHKMEVEFNNDGVDILGIYVCPHNWEEGCYCRKPNPGLLMQASKDHLFRLDKSLFIGDDPRDCQAAWNAGCFSIFIGDFRNLKTLIPQEMPMLSSLGMIDALEVIDQFYSNH